MDALEFLKERKRMCKSYGIYCGECPLKEATCILSSEVSDEVYEKIIATVEQWLKEHPLKTRQSVFLEQYPEAYVLEDGYLEMCPVSISAAHRGSNGGCKSPTNRCRDCRREFWMREVE